MNQGVTADEFALMRAVAQGVDLSVAARQYLLRSGRMPETKALLLWFDQLLVRVASAAATLPEAERQTALRGLRLLQPAAEVAPVAASATDVPVHIDDDRAGTPPLPLQYRPWKSSQPSSMRTCTSKTNWWSSTRKNTARSSPPARRSLRPS